MFRALDYIMYLQQLARPSLRTLYPHYIRHILYPNIASAPADFEEGIGEIESCDNHVDSSNCDPKKGLKKTRQLPFTVK